MFTETLELSLDLTIKSDRFGIPGADIKNFRIHQYDWGFEAEADFWICSERSEDKLYDKFTTQDIIEARLSVEGVYNLPSPKPDPLVVKGLVTEKSVRERNFAQIKETPVLFRRYSICFRDAASVLWRQHFPSALYVDAKMGDVIKAQVVEGISLKMDWQVLEETRPVICLGLGDFRNPASFYDFIFWFVHMNNGVIWYDSKKSLYTLSDSKETKSAEVEINPREVESLDICFPETGRHGINILNAYTDSPKTAEVKNTQAVSGIRRDIHIRAPISKDFDSRKALETNKIKKHQDRKHEVELEFGEYPAKTFRAGCFVKLKEDEWSRQLFAYGKEYRLIRVCIEGTAQNPEPENDLSRPHTSYAVRMSAGMEEKGNPRVHMPPFNRPYYPLRVEGKIVSESGEQTDKTYQIYTDKDTSLDHYTVNVPLWNQNIRIPYGPNFFPAHFYFPAYKHTRVLLDIYFDRGEIARFLDWGARVRLPMSPQGNHMLLGQNASSETSIKHDFKDKKPVLSVKRVSGVDTELIKLEEGTLILQTMEEESSTTTEETYDMTPQVEAARAQLAMENRSAAGGVTADFQATKTGINSRIDETVGGTKAELEAMDSAISGKAAEINSKAEAAMRQLSEKSGQLKSQAEIMKAELASMSEL